MVTKILKQNWMTGLLVFPLTERSVSICMKLNGMKMNLKTKSKSNKIKIKHEHEMFRFVAGAIVKIIFRSDDHQQNDIGGKLNEMEDDDDEMEDDDDDDEMEDDDDDWPGEIKMTGNVLRQYGDDVPHEITMTGNVLP